MSEYVEECKRKPPKDYMIRVSNMITAVLAQLLILKERKRIVP